MADGFKIILPNLSSLGNMRNIFILTLKLTSYKLNLAISSLLIVFKSFLTGKDKQLKTLACHQHTQLAHGLNRAKLEKNLAVS